MVTINQVEAPNEGVILKASNVKAFFGQESCGDGILFITEDNVRWQKSESTEGFSLQYTLISMHGICRDVSTFPHECVLCLVDAVLPGSTLNQADNEVTEVRFVPGDSTMLEKIYNEIAECQKNHPDPDEEYDEDEEEDFEMYDENSEDIQLSEEGQAVLQRLAGTMQMPSQDEFVGLIQENEKHSQKSTENGQFEDADLIEEER